MEIIKTQNGFVAKYVVGDAIKTEPITQESLSVLQWYWRNISANDYL